MRKKLKSRLRPFVLAAVFSLITLLGMSEKAFATQAPPSGLTGFEFVPVSYSSTASSLSTTSVPFQTVNATSMQKYDIKGLSNYSFWGTNDPLFVGNSFLCSWKWKTGDKSRLTIA